MPKIQWMWQDDIGSFYKDFDEDMNLLLEFIFTRRHVKYNGSSCVGDKSPIASFTTPSRTSGVKWTFNFDEMTQTSNGLRDGVVVGSSRKIIRGEDGEVWIWYESSSKTNFYGFNNLLTIDKLNSRTSRGAQGGMNTAIVPFTYLSIIPSKTIECSNLQLKAVKHTCNSNVIIELVDVNTLRPPVQGIAAQVTQQYPHTTTAAAAPELWQGYQEYHTHQHQQPSAAQPYPVAAAAPTAAPVYSQHQSQLPTGWITQKDTQGNFFYVNTKTGVSQWEMPVAATIPPPSHPPPPPPGYVIQYADKRPYYFNSKTNEWHWVYNGGKTGKKKKRIIKRKKTYKKGRYTKRKTIKR
jgi:hypothetical protein